MAIKAEGPTSILELPGMMSNVISYTRLAAIGMSKAGLALAFNTIGFVTILGLNPETTIAAHFDVVMFVVALLILIVGHLTVFILGCFLPVCMALGSTMLSSSKNSTKAAVSSSTR